LQRNRHEATSPVLVGVAQVEQRIEDYTAAREPLDLMIAAVRAAAEDAGSRELIAKANSVRVIRGIWPYKNPARIVAESVGVPKAETALTPFGGNFVQTAVNVSCLDILAGLHDIILITGAECGHTRAKARKADVHLEWQQAPGVSDRIIGEDRPMLHEAEMACGLYRAIQFYPMFENALRASRGESIDDHLRRISELWAGFSKIASANPHAWLRDPVSAEEVRTLGPKNRPVSFPYPKLMNSNISVDMGAALILTNVKTAKALGIPKSRWVYPQAGTDAHDTDFVSNRDTLYRSPAINIAGRRAMELAGLIPADVDYVDLYSCFPVAVQVSAAEMGFEFERPLTVTGGLTFNGGPLNNYVMHAIARMVEILREAPGKTGLVTANGGFLTKHAFGVYSSEPPDRPFQYEDCQSEVYVLPTRELAVEYTGRGMIESYTVMYGAEDPETAFASVLTPESKRTWAVTRDGDVMQAMTKEEFVGQTCTIGENGLLEM